MTFGLGHKDIPAWCSPLLNGPESAVRLQERRGALEGTFEVHGQILAVPLIQRLHDLRYEHPVLQDRSQPELGLDRIFEQPKRYSEPLLHLRRVVIERDSDMGLTQGVAGHRVGSVPPSECLPGSLRGPGVSEVLP